MAGNTRGKLKEQLEGVHNNFDWSQKHIQSALGLIKGQKPNLSDALKALYESVTAMDKLAQDIYAQL